MDSYSLKSVSYLPDPFRSTFSFRLLFLVYLYKADPFSKKDWYDIKAPSLFTTRNVGKTLVSRTQGTKVTLEALGEIFEAARGTMCWLGDCAKVIASENQPVRWTTPLGLPVVQTYFKTKRHIIKTSLQVLALQREGSTVEVKKQRTAFPPNFVHSLDGTHMKMTVVACRDAGLRFAGVHDSFWTHACDIDQMNVILREKFVELYSTPILENLLESFQTSIQRLNSLPYHKEATLTLTKF